MSRRVVIEIQDGKIKVEASGFTGKACINDLKWLDEILGAPKRRIFKDSFNKVEGVKIRG